MENTRIENSVNNTFKAIGEIMAAGYERLNEIQSRHPGVPVKSQEEPGSTEMNRNEEKPL